MDQLDFWAGSFGLLLFGFVEILVFTRAFGMERGWEEITHGAKLRIPSFFRFVIAWVMPLAMGAILLSWSATNLGPELSLAHVEPDDRPYVIGARVLVAALVVGFGLAVRAASHRRRALEAAS